MTNSLRVSAILVAAALAACGGTHAAPPGLHLNEPTAVAAFRGHTAKYPDLHWYFAIADASGNELTIVDAVDDSIVPAPVPLRPVVFPVPGRPALLASANLGDGNDKPDLLVVVAAGDSKLQIVSTWDPSGAVTSTTIELGGDVLALASVGSPAREQARIAAALSGDRLAVVTLSRAPDGTTIDVAGASVASATFLFQPVALAAVPGDATKVYAATADPIPIPGGTLGVAEFDVSGVPTVSAVLDARAPTRLVAAADLWDASSASTALDISAFDVAVPRQRRVYAVLDERGCGLNAPIACGLVAIDRGTQALLLDPDPVGTAPTMHALFRAPIAVPGTALAIAAAQPPAVAPADAPDPSYAGTYVRMITAAGVRWTTATAAVASTDGSLYFVDPARWEIPGEQIVQPTATLIAHANPDALATEMSVTAGYTPTIRWTATYQGQLPGMTLRRAESGSGAGGPWLALQATSAVGVEEVVRVFDPSLMVSVGDIAVIELAPGDPDAIGSCALTFEAAVADFIPPDPPPSVMPGGALQLIKIPGHPEWDPCVDALATGKTGMRATVRAGGWILFRGTGTSAVQVGRPQVGTKFVVQWADETALSCPTWPVSSCEAACRVNCANLIKARIARRIGYVPSQGNPQGSALEFTLRLKSGVTATRDLAVVIDTAEGRAPFHTAASGVTPVDARAVIPFDRSPVNPGSGVRFLVPYASGVVLDATPTIQGGNPGSLH